MVTRLTTVLTLVITLLHSVMGCCWHHAHDCSCGAVSHPVFSQHETLAGAGHGHHVCVLAHHKTICHEGEGCPHSDREGPAHHHDVCEEADCVYVASKSVKVPSMATEVTLLTSGTPDDVTAAVGAAMTGKLHHDKIPWTDSHLRRALLQVWLI